MPCPDESSSRTSFQVLLVLPNAKEAKHSSQIDTDKLAQLAGFASGKSANNSWLIIKKKLMNGATVEAATAATNTKKSKGKAATNGDGDDDNEATPTKAAPKKRSKAIKTEPVDAEVGDADTEKTPSAESPKKGRAKKNAVPPNTDTTNGDATNDTGAAEISTPAPKRKRGPNKPKDPNAPPSKRAKKGANAAATTSADDATEDNNDAANTQLHTEGSIFGGDAHVKKEEDEDEVEEGDDRIFDAEEQKMADEALLDEYTAEGQVA